MNVVIVRVVFYNPHTAVVCLFLGLLQCFKDAYPILFCSMESISPFSHVKHSLSELNALDCCGK